jgi:hypothetical protein
MGYSGPNLGRGNHMSDQFHDDDIEFDFFEDVDTREEPAPQEQPVREERPPGGPRRPAQRPSGPGMPPKARLIGLIAAASSSSCSFPPQLHG